MQKLPMGHHTTTTTTTTTTLASSSTLELNIRRGRPPVRAFSQPNMALQLSSPAGVAVAPHGMAGEGGVVGFGSYPGQVSSTRVSLNSTRSSTSSSSYHGVAPDALPAPPRLPISDMNRAPSLTGVLGGLPAWQLQPSTPPLHQEQLKPQQRQQVVPEPQLLSRADGLAAVAAAAPGVTAW